MSTRFKFVREHHFCVVTILALISSSAVVCHAQDFPPASQDELKMTSDPQAPGAPAIILFREVNCDNNGFTSHEDNYVRIKILTEEGRHYADVAIPFDWGEEVINIRARTVHPDGSIVDFHDEIFTRNVTEAQGLAYLAKTFVLPDVQVGSIVEYRYTYNLWHNLIFQSHWILNSYLFTKTARFSLRPYGSDFARIGLRWTWQGLPPGAEPKEGHDHVLRMEVHNIAAFEVEDFMPPENEMKSRVDFITESEFFDKEPNEYWRHVDKKWNTDLEDFLGRRKPMEDAVMQIISPNDPAEVKLRKIYDRVQQLRNTSYEVEKTAQEQKRDKEKSVYSVDDVWKHGYGTDVELTWLFLGLVRAAGFDACGVWVSSRREYFFDKSTMENHKLNTNTVLVRLNQKELYFDPGAAFTPFGMLTWSETGAPGLCLDKEGGRWVTTSLPRSSESGVDRAAKLKLTETGSLEGTVTITYTGLDAMYHRVEARDDDETARKKLLEDLMKAQVPLPSEVELTNRPDWSNSEMPLVAEFKISIPNWASSAGKRTAITGAVFTAAEKHLFESEARVHPIYLQYPFHKLDDITIELPQGSQVTSLPAAEKKDEGLVLYTLELKKDGDTIHLTRKLNMDFLLLQQKYYSALRKFFQAVRAADDQQIILEIPISPARN